MEAGHALGASNIDVASIAPSTMIIGRSNLAVPITALKSYQATASQTAAAPAYSYRLGSAGSSRPQTSYESASSEAGLPIRIKLDSMALPRQRSSS